MMWNTSPWKLLVGNIFDSRLIIIIIIIIIIFPPNAFRSRKWKWNFS